MRHAVADGDAAFLATEAFGSEAVEFYDHEEAQRGSSSGMPVCKDAFEPSYPCNQDGGSTNATDIGCSFIRGSDRSTVYLLTRSPPALSAAAEAALEKEHEAELERLKDVGAKTEVHLSAAHEERAEALAAEHVRKMRKQAELDEAHEVELQR